jgi:manganese-transporting P-type ATPase
MVQVYRAGQWEKIPGEMLLPGDVFSVVLPHSDASQKNEDDAVAPADAVLISGSCMADEAVLTGESIPQWKESISDANAQSAAALRELDIRQDKRHVIFGGTKVLNVSPGPASEGGLKTPDGGALAVVLRTGFETAQGRLMRMILFSTEHLSANTVETGLFILFLLIFAIAAAGTPLHNLPFCALHGLLSA